MYMFNLQLIEQDMRNLLEHQRVEHTQRQDHRCSSSISYLIVIMQVHLDMYATETSTK